MAKVNIKIEGISYRVEEGKTILEAAKINLEDILQVETSENMIILKKIQKHKTFEERLAEYNGEISICDFDWGDPLGKELI